MCLVTLKMYSKSPIIQVRPCLKVMCQVFMMDGPASGPLPAGGEAVVVSVAAWQEDWLACCVKGHVWRVLKITAVLQRRVWRLYCWTGLGELKMCDWWWLLIELHQQAYTKKNYKDEHISVRMPEWKSYVMSKLFRPFTLRSAFICITRNGEFVSGGETL